MLDTVSSRPAVRYRAHNQVYRVVGVTVAPRCGRSRFVGGIRYGHSDPLPPAEQGKCPRPELGALVFRHTSPVLGEKAIQPAQFRCRTRRRQPGPGAAGVVPNRRIRDSAVTDAGKSATRMQMSLSVQLGNASSNSPASKRTLSRQTRLLA